MGLRIWTGRLRGLRCWCLGLLALAGLGGCIVEPPAPLHIGTSVWPGFDAVYLADRHGSFDSQRVLRIDMPNATSVLYALRSGHLDLAAINLDEALSILQDGHDLRILALLSYSRGDHALMTLEPRLALSELRGRRLALESVSSHALMTRYALDAVAMDESQVIWIEARGRELAKALEQGRVAAVAVDGDQRQRLEERAAETLFSSDRLPFPLTGVLVARGEALREHRRLIHALVRAIMEENGALHRPDPTSLQALADRHQREVATVTGLYTRIEFLDLDDNRRLLGDGGAALLELAARTTAFLLDKALIARPVTRTDYVDARWLAEVRP